MVYQLQSAVLKDRCHWVRLDQSAGGDDVDGKEIQIQTPGKSIVIVTIGSCQILLRVRVRKPFEGRKRGKAMASVFHSVTATVGWRNHDILEDFDENDSPKPDKFRKLPSNSLNTFRMSLRKRLPLKAVEINIDENPSWESLELKKKEGAVQTVSRTAKNAFGTVSQKVQKRCQSSNKHLMTTPTKGRAPRRHSGMTAAKKSIPACTPQKTDGSVSATTTPIANSKQTPASSKRRSHWSGTRNKHLDSDQKQRKSLSAWVGNGTSSVRRSVRATALRSPYASPAPLKGRLFDKDLETVSTGIRQLKRLSQAFDYVIVKDEREQAIANYHHLMTRNLQSATQYRKVCRLTLRRSTRKIQKAVHTWTNKKLIGLIGTNTDY
ncbi:protein PIMREG [Protopterus annectens]|uniref:protein PIMREG n=1 Tax=Protopterus annectens TaxID=7888 RepID=UPI001CF9CDF1|nr:protein PIMREG [Protopterus annectens]